MEVNIVFIFIVSITNNLIAKLTTLLGCEISENKFTLFWVSGIKTRP